MTPNRRKFVTITALVSAWAFLILARLVYLQIYQFDSLTHQAKRQQERTIEVSPVRGVVYDRNFHPLAMSVEVDSIFAVPSEIPNPDQAAKVLAPVLDMSATEIEKRLTGGRFFSWIKRKVSDTEAKHVRELNLKGIYAQPESKRFYPKRELASHLLGYVGMDGQGLGGIELAYDRSIRGRSGQLLIETDARQHWLNRAGKAPEPGGSVVLTLDENIQYVVEKELGDAVNEFRPTSASVVVQDPQTGEILAMASYPTFNPNTYADTHAEAKRNWAVSASYEPGSTFKIATIAAALEEKVTTPNEGIDCQMGAIVLAGHVIHDHQKYGVLTVNEVMQNSSDVGVIKLALRMGNDTFYRYMQKFGFGVPTGIELPGEARGLTKPPERWSKISIGAMAMGQEVGVTPLQITALASAVANGGWWVRPHIVREGDRTTTGDAPPERRRIMSEKTAEELRHMLTLVVTNGTAPKAQLNGYTSAGKTGTAQKIDPRTHRYSPYDYVGSFVGFAPVENPMFTIIVVVDSPHGKKYGGDVAAPVFKRIAEQILSYRNVPPSLPLKQDKAHPNRNNEMMDDAPANIASADSDEAAKHASDAQEPDETAMLNLDEGVVAPDYLGKTVRAVAEESQTARLNVRLVGSGVAFHQSPMPGKKLADGQKITVWFKVGGTAGLRAEKIESTLTHVSPSPAHDPARKIPVVPTKLPGEKSQEPVQPSVEVASATSG